MVDDRAESHPLSAFVLRPIVSLFVRAEFAWMSFHAQIVDISVMCLHARRLLPAPLRAGPLQPSRLCPVKGFRRASRAPRRLCFNLDVIVGYLNTFRVLQICQNLLKIIIYVCIYDRLCAIFKIDPDCIVIIYTH